MNKWRDVNKKEFLKALNDYEGKHGCKLDCHVSTICEPAMFGYYDLTREYRGHVLLVGRYWDDSLEDYQVLKEK